MEERRDDDAGEQVGERADVALGRLFGAEILAPCFVEGAAQAEKDEAKVILQELGDAVDDTLQELCRFHAGAGLGGRYGKVLQGCRGGNFGCLRGGGEGGGCASLTRPMEVFDRLSMA